MEQAGERSALADGAWPQNHGEECKAMVLNMLVKIPFEVKHPLYGGHLRPPENTDIYITMHDSSKIIVVK